MSVLDAVKPASVTVTGPAGLSVIQTDLLTGNIGTTGWIDTKAIGGMRWVSVQLIGSAGISAGTVFFETTSDPATAATLVNLSTTSASVSSSTAVAANSSAIWMGQVNARYFRVRISTGFTGGTVQAIAEFAQNAPAQSIQAVSISGIPTALVSGTGAEDNASTNTPVVVGGVARTVEPAATIVNGDAIRATFTTMGALTVANGAAVRVTEQASAAITTTTTSAAVTPPTSGRLMGTFNVTAVSGTSPTLDVVLEEFDGITWVPRNQLPRITSAGAYSFDFGDIFGQHRWVQTISGTSPSFTRSITTLQGSVSGQIIRSRYDYNVNGNATGGPFCILNVEGCKTIQLASQMASGGSAFPTVFLYSSVADPTVIDAYGMASYATAVSATQQAQPTQVPGRHAGIYVTVAGTGSTVKYIAIRAQN